MPVATSILRFGFGNPILAREANREVIAGHTRLAALAFLASHVLVGKESRDSSERVWRVRREEDGPFVLRGAPGPGLAPIRLLDLDEEEAHALALADNRLGEIADWDEPKLAEALAGLKLGGFEDLDVLGWSASELDDLLGKPEPSGPPSPPPRLPPLPGNARIHLGRCEAVMAQLPSESFDSSVSDPPYGLSEDLDEAEVRDLLAAWLRNEPWRGRVKGFMGREWDAFVPGPDVWREVLRLLKPGGHVVAFSGTRTVGWLTLALKLAGFEVREVGAWCYWCVDEATEALTPAGWVNYRDLRVGDPIAAWDPTTEAIRWEPVEAINVQPFDGEMVRIAGKFVDQLVTPNHRVFGKFAARRKPLDRTWREVLAGEIGASWDAVLPVAGKLSGGVGGPGPERARLLGWWLTDAWKHGDGKACMFSQCKPDGVRKLREVLAPYAPSEYVRPAKKPEHSPEHVWYLSGEPAEWLRATAPDRELRWEVLLWSEEDRRALLDALVDGDGSRTDSGWTFWSKVPERRAIVLALASTLGWRAQETTRGDGVHVNVGRAEVRVRRDLRTRERYTGNVWCPVVATGAWLARRGRHVFATGNSGFPKSVDVATSIDRTRKDEADVRRLCEWLRGAIKAAGWNNRKVDGFLGTNGMAAHLAAVPGNRQPHAISPEALARLATAMGSAVPPEIRALCDDLDARKGEPGEAWAEREVLGYKRQIEQGMFGSTILGGSGLTVEVPQTAPTAEAAPYAGLGTALKPTIEPWVLARKPLGRAGARPRTVAACVLEFGTGALNIDACRFPEGDPMWVGPSEEVPDRPWRGSGVRHSFGGFAQDDVDRTLTRNPLGRWPSNLLHCPKPSRKEREAGCGHLPVRTSGEATDRKDGSAGLDSPRAGAGRTSGEIHNHHPTLKPLRLMAWLARLVTPAGGRILDPFAGSGTAGAAAVPQGYHYDGIEVDPDFVAIAEARVAHWAAEGLGSLPEGEEDEEDAA